MSKWQIKRQFKDTREEVIDALVFGSEREAQSYCDTLNDLHPNIYHYPVEVMEGPFMLDSNGDIIPNPRRD